MAWFLGQSLLYIALAFLLGLLVGWLIWGRTASSPSTSVEPVAETTAEPVTEVEPARTTAEPIADADAVPTAEPLVDAEPVAEVEPVVNAEPVAEAEPAVAEAEPVVEPEPTVEPEAVIEPEAIAEPASEIEPAEEPGPDVEPVAEPAADAESTTEPVAEPAAAPVAVATSADNLQRLEGIGPKISNVLVAAGIRTYGDLAATDQATLTETLRKGGVRFAPSLSTWNSQAELLARGDEAGFRALAKELVAGRKVR